MQLLVETYNHADSRIWLLGEFFHCPTDIWLPYRNILYLNTKPFFTFFANIFVWNYVFTKKIHKYQNFF